MAAEIAPANVPPAYWQSWSRHEQKGDDRSDPRMAGLLVIQQRFIDTDEWARTWRYLVGLLLQNEVHPARIAEVFEPMRRCFLEPSGSGKRKEKAARQRRKATLDAAMSRAKAALSLPSELPVPVNEAGLREAGAPFVEQGAGPERLAVTLTAAYWQRGADIGTTAALWFPLLTLVDDPDFGGGAMKWLRKGARAVFRKNHPRWDRERRQRFVDGASAHLFRGGSLEDLPVAILGRDTAVSENRSGSAQFRIPRGEAAEVLGGAGGQLLLRPGEERRSYTALESILRVEPIVREPAAGQPGNPLSAAGRTAAVRTI